MLGHLITLLLVLNLVSRFQAFICCLCSGKEIEMARDARFVFVTEDDVCSVDVGGFPS